MMPVLIVLALLGAACAAPRNSNRIVGGETTTIENYPYMVRMIYNVRHPMCGGALITNTAIVSASHCYLYDPPSLWEARLGSTFSTSGGNVHLVSKIIMHENYTSGLFLNDVAIIKLRNATVFSDQIKIARIAGPKYILPDNTPVTAIGWGVTSYEGPSNNVLRHVEVNIINQKICTDRYAFLKSQPGKEYIPDVTPDMMCTGILDVGGKDACQGDSGGPVIHNGDIVVGIVSWGYKCGHKSYPGVKTRVTSYTDWIFTNALN